MNYVLVIPARYQSTRLPGKPLIDIEGESLLLRTYKQCLKAVPSSKIYVATDDERVVKHCEMFNMQVVLTSPDCLTGTDRIGEFANYVKADTYINVQGDEPLINPLDIHKVIKTASLYPNDLINGYAPIESDDQYKSLTIPKVVVRPDGRLLYMSRSPIPGNKKGEFNKSWRQICIYGFPKKALMEFTNLENKTDLEREEDIEILRFLEMGYEVRMIELSSDSVAVDTPSDVEKVINIIRSRHEK